jgi:isoquinoline 1-oxidoreductase subunit alpha
MPVSAAANAVIRTIEGISRDGSHPVQVAWEALDVPQCGYCQAGQIMSACALLAKNPKPTDADIDSAMNGNLCRRGTYLRVRAAVNKAAELTASTTAKTTKSGAKVSGAGANRLSRKGGQK